MTKEKALYFFVKSCNFFEYPIYSIGLCLNPMVIYRYSGF